MVNIKLKWNKVTFDDVSIDVTASVDTLKELINELTDVPKDRQKLMAKGAWIGTLKDDADLSKLKIVEGQVVMLMGSAEVVEKPSKPVEFLEDMTMTELVQKGAIIPAGLQNLGNTCYMNATVECLRYMPELRRALGEIPNPTLASVLRNTYNTMDASPASIPPMSFVNTLRTQYPQFAERSQQSGGFVQQDAEEFYNTLMSVVANDLQSTTNSFNSLLGLRLEQQLKCQQCDLEPVVTHYEEVNKLVCNIQGGSGAALNVNHMSEGVKLGFEGTIEKHSQILGTNAVWDKKTRVATLPRYICFQFMRFFWKATPESRDHQGVKCKILRAVTFPETIDMYELCSESLQQKLKQNRAVADKHFEVEFAAKRAKMTAENTSNSTAATSTAMDVDSSSSTGAAVGDVPNAKVSSEETVFAAANSAASSATDGYVEIGNGLPANFTGLYELCGVVTHKGRSADSGHYIGWVRQDPGSDFWWCFDDEKVTEVRTDSILQLKGGGDREMAYLNFYRYKETAHGDKGN